MPLFASKKDSRFLKSVTKEVMNKIISMEIALYKLALPEMETNLYNESDKKVYYNPVRLYCQVTKEEVSMNDLDTGMDTSQIATFLFLREDLLDCGVFIEEGDIIAYNALYYEIDNAQTMQYWAGRNDETFLMNTEGRGNRNFGYNPTIKVQAHLTRLSQLNLAETRSGTLSIKNTNFLPKNL
jgi:hypothetical protein